MHTSSRFTVRLLPVALALVLGPVGHAQQAPAPAPETAKTWLGRAAEMEDYLRTAKVVKMEQTSVGVTRPRRAYLEPGGPVDSMTWKPIRPGASGGFFESYRSEIAAYELDKLLGLHTKPPTVERQVSGERGAAVLWASPTRSFKELGCVPGQKGVAAPPSARIPEWNRQIVRAKMFDNLIANKDPNLGNWRPEVPRAARDRVLVVRSGWFDVLGFLLGLTALFLGVLLEVLSRSFRKTA